MNNKDSVQKQIISLRERILSNQNIDGSVIELYYSLEKDFKEYYPQVSFENYEQITHLSKVERFFGNMDNPYWRKVNPILNRLEYMISFFPENLKNQPINITITSIENFNQSIKEMNIDASIKEIIIKNINDLDKEIKKDKPSKNKIWELATKLYKSGVPQDILRWIITILLTYGK
jgi:hypothetical protein